MPILDSKRKRSIILFLIGLLVLIVYLYFFVDISEMFKVIQDADPFYYSLAIFVVLLNVLTGTLTWHYLLRSLSILVPFRRTFLIAQVGFFAEFFIPSESIGEDAVKFYLMTKESRENAGKVMASVVSCRILAIVMTFSTLVIAFVSLLTIGYKLPMIVSTLMLLITIGNAIPLVLLVFMCLKEGVVYKLADLLFRFIVFISRGHPKITSLKSKIKNVVNIFHQSIRFLVENPRSFVLPTIFSIIGYCLSVFVSFLVFVSLGYNVNIILVAIVYTVSRSLQTIPVMIPGDIGFTEVVMTNLYALIGVPLVISAVATVLTRIIWFCSRLPIGFVAFNWIVSRDAIGIEGLRVEERR